MTVHRVGYFVGSLSSESINRVLAKALVRPSHMQMTEIPIGGLPLAGAAARRGVTEP